MAIILDADVVIGGERRAFDLGTWLRSRASEQFEIAAVTLAELWHSVERAGTSQKSARESYLTSLLNVLPIIPYTEQTAYHHSRIWAELESSGNMIGPYDLIVAATAVERESTLATFNHRHFANVKGLTLIYPK